MGLLMDTFHYFVSQVSDDDTRSIPVEKLYGVHVNDCEDRLLDELEDQHRLYPTFGVIPLQQKLSILSEMGYQGYLSVELFRPSYWEQPIEDIVRDAYASYNRLVQML